MSHPEEVERIRQVYETTYRPDPEDRSYLWHPLNPVSVYYRQAQERALIALCRRFELPLASLRLLDVGCGPGSLLRFWASLGVDPANLSGLDLMEYRIEQARRLCPPETHLQTGNAAQLPYPANSFDLVCQFTVFSSILDAGLRQDIASEMLRVLKPGGWLVWYDLSPVRSTAMHGTSLAELAQLFPHTACLAVRRLHPPRGTRLARQFPALCQLWDVIPGLPKTHILALLQKQSGPMEQPG